MSPKGIKNTPASCGPPKNETLGVPLDYSIPLRMKYDTGKTMIVGQISSREVSEMWKSEILYNEIWLNFIDYFTHNSSTALPLIRLKSPLFPQVLSSYCKSKMGQ